MFVRSEALGGKSVVRVAVADRMATDACSAGRTKVPPPAVRPVAKKKAPSTAARPQTRVVKLASRPVRTAEQEIPFEDSGTFGEF